MTVSTFVFAIIAGVLPSFIWLWFWLREDSLNPEPRSLLTATFIGGLLAVIAAIFAERFVAETVSDPIIRYAIWSAIEEIFKFIAVLVIALNTDWYDEPIDAMIYCIVVALGFAALENTIFIMNPFAGGQIAEGLFNGNMRFIGATLVHIVSSATVGFTLAITFYRSYFTKFIAVTAGLIIAIAFHTAFNLSIINSNDKNILHTFAWVWVAVVILIILFEEIKVVRQKQ